MKKEDVFYLIKVAAHRLVDAMSLLSLPVRLTHNWDQHLYL